MSNIDGETMLTSMEGIWKYGGKYKIRQTYLGQIQLMQLTAHCEYPQIFESSVIQDIFLVRDSAQESCIHTEKMRRRVPDLTV